MLFEPSAMRACAAQVKGLEFNTFSPNLLASGAADSDLCIWDLAKPSMPSLYPALKVGWLLGLGDLCSSTVGGRRTGAGSVPASTGLTP